MKIRFLTRLLLLGLILSYELATAAPLSALAERVLDQTEQVAQTLRRFKVDVLENALVDVQNIVALTGDPSSSIDLLMFATMTSEVKESILEYTKSLVLQTKNPPSERERDELRGTPIEELISAYGTVIMSFGENANTISVNLDEIHDEYIQIQYLRENANQVAVLFRKAQDSIVEIDKAKTALAREIESFERVLDALRRRMGVATICNAHLAPSDPQRTQALLNKLGMPNLFKR